MHMNLKKIVEFFLFFNTVPQCDKKILRKACVPNGMAQCDIWWGILRQAFMTKEVISARLV